MILRGAVNKKMRYFSALKKRYYSTTIIFIDQILLYKELFASSEVISNITK
jgi:hypothetical protein